MPTRFPDARIHDDRTVDPRHLDLLPIRSGRRIHDHILPPGVLDVLLEQNTQRPVIPEAIDPTVDLARLKDKSLPPAQRHELFHVHRLQILTSTSDFKFPISNLTCDL